MTAGAAGPSGPSMPAGGNTNQQPSSTFTKPTRAPLFTIDVGRQVAEIEGVLRAGGDLAPRIAALAILERWQFDEMLDAASRKKASLLVREFASDGHDGGRR